jgi:hypothetical protein
MDLFTNDCNGKGIMAYEKNRKKSTKLKFQIFEESPRVKYSFSLIAMIVNYFSPHHASIDCPM